MKLSKIIISLYESAKAKFIGPCDRFRLKSEENEQEWQKMMREKVQIRESEFVNNVDISGILDEDETWEEYKKTAEGIKFYRSGRYYFFQHAGFEFLFK